MAPCWLVDARIVLRCTVREHKGNNPSQRRPANSSAVKKIARAVVASRINVLADGEPLADIVLTAEPEGLSKQLKLDPLALSDEMASVHEIAGWHDLIQRHGRHVDRRQVRT